MESQKYYTMKEIFAFLKEYPSDRAKEYMATEEWEERLASRNQIPNANTEVWITREERYVSEFIRQDHAGDRLLEVQRDFQLRKPELYGSTIKVSNGYGTEKRILERPYPKGYEHLANKPGRYPYLVNWEYLFNLLMTLEDIQFVSEGLYDYKIPMELIRKEVQHIIINKNEVNRNAKIVSFTSEKWDEFMNRIINKIQLTHDCQLINLERLLNYKYFFSLPDLDEYITIPSEIEEELDWLIGLFRDPFVIEIDKEVLMLKMQQSTEKKLNLEDGKSYNFEYSRKVAQKIAKRFDYRQNELISNIKERYDIYNVESKINAIHMWRLFNDIRQCILDQKNRFDNEKEWELFRDRAGSYGVKL